MSQTDGPPLPEVGPVLLDGHAPAEPWDRLAAQVAGAGFTLTRGDCRPANGRTDFVARAVIVRDDVTEAQAAKTLAHDLLTALGGGPPLGGRDLFEWYPLRPEEGGRPGGTASPGEWLAGRHEPGCR